MRREHRRRAGLVAVLAVVVAGIGTVAAQEDPGTTAPPATDPPPETTAPPPTTEPTGWFVPDLTSTTTSAVPPDTTDTTAGPTETTDTTAAPAEPGTEAPPEDPGPLPEDLGEGDEGGGTVPSTARALINAIPRSAPNDNHALVEGVAALEAVGVGHDEAVRTVYGAFPILGPSHWTDDWYNARWTGSTFRHHLGLDMFAAYGTPIGSPADGVARISSSALGGLSVRVVEPDGTFWYLAHLSAVADGLVDGAAVTVGTVVGYVGDSGNARGGSPHLHFAVHPRGGEPVPPKPIVDQWVIDGAARVVQLLATESAVPEAAAIVASDLTRRLADGVAAGPEGAAGPPRSELLWASAASPNGGAVAVADAAAASLNEGVDWEQRGAEQRSRQLAWTQSADRAWQIVSPLVHPLLRRTVEARRST